MILQPFDKNHLEIMQQENHKCCLSKNVYATLLAGDWESEHQSVNLTKTFVEQQLLES